MKIREDKILDEGALYGIFHNIRITDTAVHHKILLDLLKRLVVKHEPDPSGLVIGATMYDTVSI
mgnify:CR=1 FL=1